MRVETARNRSQGVDGVELAFAKVGLEVHQTAQSLRFVKDSLFPQVSVK